MRTPSDATKASTRNKVCVWAALQGLAEGWQLLNKPYCTEIISIWIKPPFKLRINFVKKNPNECLHLLLDIVYVLSKCYKNVRYLFDVEGDEELENNDKGKKWTEVESNKEQRLVVDQVQSVSGNVELWRSNPLAASPKNIHRYYRGCQ